MTLSIILAFEYIYWDEKTIWKFLQGWRVQVMYEEWTDGTLALNCPCWYIFNMERDVADFFLKIFKINLQFSNCSARDPLIWVHRMLIAITEGYCSFTIS